LLKVFDSNKQVIHQYENIDVDYPIEFNIKCKQLLDVYEDDTTVCLFYGFLDVEINPKSSPAETVKNIISKNFKKNLLQLYGSFIVLYYQKPLNEISIFNDALGDFLINFTFEDNSYKLADFSEALLNKNNKAVNIDRIQHYFGLTQPCDNNSFFKNISLQKPGQIVLLKDGKFITERYYNPPTKINYKKIATDQLCKQYNQLLTQAIELQTQGHDRIGVLMSGGLDSTLIVANSKEAGLDVNCYSYVFPKTSESDETMWIESMRKLNMNMFTFAGENYWPLKSPWYISINSPYSNPYRHLKDVISSQADHNKVKFLLTGVFADHAYSGYIYWLVDLLKKNPFKAILEFIKVIKNKGITTALKQVSPKKWSSKDMLTTSWLTKEVNQLLQNKLSNRPVKKIAHKQKHNLIFGINSSQDAYFENEYSFKNNIYLRNPYRDRRVVEFVTSLPAFVLGDIYNRKSFARLAAKDLLPDIIVRRKTVTTLQPLLIRGVLVEEFTKVKKLLLAEDTQWQNYVQKDIIQKMLDNPTTEYKESDYLAFWLCIGFELWMKRLKAL
jgi:asparagine synthetase B (glutamine-hydrolysing)